MVRFKVGGSGRDRQAIQVIVKGEFDSESLYGY